MKGIFLFFALAFSYGVADESVIHPSLLKEMNEGNTKNVFVSMKGGNDQVIDEINSRTFSSREEKVAALMEGSRANAAMSQAPVVNYLKGTRVKSYQSFALTNEVYVMDVGPQAIMAMAALPNVASIREEAVIPILAPVDQAYGTNQMDECNKTGVEWGVEAIRSPEAWKANCNGTNVVVAILDTGVNRKHRDLINNYRGGDYSWMDPFTPMNPTREPTDCHSHGTHVCGSAVGRNGVGVAPGASWIACRACSTETCREYHLKTCGEWASCPYKMSDSTKKCDLKSIPHVINNSWGGPGGDTYYNGIIKFWRAAEIVPVFAVGNSGDQCETLGSPGDQPNLIGVSATNQTRHCAKFSSRGPAKKPVNGANNFNKPDLAAPGQDICSSSSTDKNARIKMSGTSMACPHVAGAVAIVVGALGVNNTRNRYENIMKILQQTSTRSIPIGQSCGKNENSRSDSQFPNHHVGTGIIDVYKACIIAQERAQNKTTTSTTTPAP